MPNTPEEVIQQYQAHYDANRFEDAKRLSTRREQFRLNELARLLAGQTDESTVLHTDFLAIDCRTEEKKAVCYCLVEDQYERYQTQFNLVKLEGRWLVDSPEEAFEIDEEVEIIQDMLEDRELE